MRELPHCNFSSSLSVGNFLFVCSLVFVFLDGVCLGPSMAGTVPKDLAPNLVYVILM